MSTLTSLPKEERLAYLVDASPYVQHAAEWFGDEKAGIAPDARDEQVAPPGDWNIWLLLAGRGFGKTRTAAEDIALWGYLHPNSRIAVVAETFGDGRDVCIEGESGLLSVFSQDDDVVAHWNRSMGELLLTNGTRYKIYSGDKPDQLRGPQFHRAWCDELSKFAYARETWDQLMFGLRLGTRPQAVVTTTPRPIEVIRELVEREDVHVTTGTTFDNAPNLSSAALRSLKERYQNTRLGQQELFGALLTEFPGALWQRKLIRYQPAPASSFVRIICAIDPAVTSDPETSDETGIIVAGRTRDGNGYVLDDITCRLSPAGWARRAVDAYYEWGCDRIVAEVNNGGDLVEYTLRSVDSRVSYRKVHASRGKRVRAEPIAALYEQGRIFHARAFPQLEDQMVSFAPDNTDGSPDRVDALVWAFAELFESRGTRNMRVIR